MEPLFFAHLTDTHINAPDKNHPLFGLDMAAKLRAVFADLGTLGTKPAFALISGDMTQDGDVADYRYLRELLDELSAGSGLPIYVGLGNHDCRAAIREGFLEESPSEESFYYSFEHEGLRVVMLNTQVSGSHDGRLDEKQLGWLADTLAAPAPEGTIAVLHHPIAPTPTERMDDHLLRNPEDLLRTIEGRDVIGLLSGHIHFHNVGAMAGIPCAAATGVAFGLDPSTPDKMRFMDNCGYNLVTVKDGRMTVQPRLLPGEHRLLYEWDPTKQPAHA